VFLALLELIRQKKIWVEQESVSDDVVIIPASEEHRKTYEHASLHLAPDVPSPPEPAPVTQSADAPAEEGAAPE
ncbi:MAG: hypothetical protein JWO87_1297, partial [Phycisphaerales bacterium]|nr:hypothetical protein [Phycisphaerales bacterium]